MGSVKKKLAKGLRKITPKEIAPALPFIAMAIPGMGFASSALLRYGLPQLLTAAASARQTGDINLLNQALALGASYAAGPATTGADAATSKELAFAGKAPQTEMVNASTTARGMNLGQVSQPTLAATDPIAFAKLDPTKFEAFKAANPGVKNTFMENLNASLRPVGEGIRSIGSGDIFDVGGLMTVGGLGATAATTDYAKKKEIEFEEDERQRMGFISDYADALANFKNYFREKTYGLEDVYGPGNVPSFLAADGGRVGFDGGGDVGIFESILGDNIVDQVQRGFITLLGGGNLLGTSMNEYDDAYDQLKEMGESHEDIIGTIGERPELIGKADGGRVGLAEGGDPTMTLAQKKVEPIIQFPGIMDPGGIGSIQMPNNNNPMSQIQNTVNSAIDNMQGSLNQNLQNSFKTETVDAIVPNDQQANIGGGFPPGMIRPPGLLGLLGGINRKGPAGFNPNMQFNFGTQLRPFQARPAVMQAGYAEGGEVAPGMPQGMQVDGRNGTFIPMGVQEKADDVPAMLSKNEFVMTADAVKGLGNGSPELGAQRMYDLMNNLETKV